MASLAEILAAKKAATASANPVVMQHPDTGLNVRQSEVAKEEIKTIPEPVKEEPANTAAPKPLTFAEKMALKKAAESGNTSSAPAPVGNAVAPTVASSTTQEEPSPKEQAPAAMAPAQDAQSSGAQLAPIPVSVDTTTPTDEVSTEARQAYTDIKEKLALLTEKSGENLKDAMSNLKAALMKNPAATLLMEDTDIGQMVIALRRLTGEDIAEASKEKKAGRKPKDKPVDLSNPDVIAQIFEDL